MKRSTKKSIALAASGALYAGSFLSSAIANTVTWQTTGAGNSQDWSTPANWVGNVAPTSTDTALFLTNNPPSSTVNVASPVGVGAILDELTNATLTLSGSTVTLHGQTLGVPQLGTVTNLSNVVLAMGDQSLLTNTLTVGNSLVLNGAQNVIVASQSSGNTSTGQTLNLNGSINGTGAQLQLLGGGSLNQYGATFNLNGNANYTGGLVIGTPLTTGANPNSFDYQSAEVVVNAGTDLPSTGNIVVNEQSQLLLNGATSFGAGTTLYLNGPGIGAGVSSPGSSGALRTLSKAAVTWAGGINFGIDQTGSAAAPDVVITVAGAGGTLTASGQLTGSGSLQKQGGGLMLITNSTNTWSGNLQVGNGTVETTATSSLPTGDLQFAQTSTNTPIVALFNPTQSIRNLSSSFAQTTGGNPQLLSLYNTSLTINETKNNIFGYGANNGLTSTIADGNATQTGTVTYHGSAGATLSLTGPNTYTGGTTISGGTLNLANASSGSATGPGSVTVNSGGELGSGGGVLQFQAVQSVSNPIVTSGTMSGALIVNSGGVISPGGDNLVGNLTIGSLTANNGSVFNFDLIGGTTAANDTLTSTGAFTLASGGTEKVNVLGSKLAYGTYTLATFGSLANSGTQFSLVGNPNGHNRNYQLVTNSNSLVLNITDTGSERYWSVGGGNPSVDGGGTWQAGSTNFFNSNPVVTQAPYSNSSTNDVVIGNGGAGGTITLTGAITVGGQLVFSQVNSPYTIASNGAADTLTLAGGIVTSASANIAAPTIVQGSQNFQAGAGTTLALSGGITESGGAAALTFGGDTGTVLLGGTNTYSGGTTVSSGVLETSTGSLPVGGNVQVNGAQTILAFTQSSNGTYSGLISGTGNVAVNGTGTVFLGNSSNSYSGATDLQSGVLSIASASALGTGAGGINLSGGTLQFTSAMSFPLGSPSQAIILAGNTTSTLDTDGNNVTLGQDISGPGNLTKIGGGILTLTGLIPTTQIGQVSILGGDLTLDPTGTASFGFSASTSPGTFTGDLTLAGSLEFRLFGGDINGGGAIRVDSSGIALVTQANSTIDNQIILNSAQASNFIFNIGVTKGNTLTVTGNISGKSDVDFTGGAGITYLTGLSTYTGATTIDNGTAGEVQLDGANGDLPSATDVHLTPSATLDLFGNVTQVIGSLDSAGGTGDVTNDPTITSKVTNNSQDPNTLATLVIDGNNGTTNFAGFITDSQNTPTPGGALAIELGPDYTGTLVLNSATYNTYSGGTILNGGTLLLGSSGDALLGASAEMSDTVISGVTFGGGTLEISTNWVSTRPLTINPGSSTISEEHPGQSINLTPASIHWNGGTLNLTNTGASTLTSGGTVSVTAPSTLAVAAGSSLAITGTTDPFTDSSNASKHVAILNNGNFSIAQVNSSIAGITGTGTLTVGNGSSANTVQLATNSGASSIGSLAIMGNSTLDITNNHLFINYGSGPDPIASIVALIKSGFANGTWTGDGIMSSLAQANSSSYGIGYADSADVGNPAGLSSGQIEIKYTLLGDANLDGKVNGSDFAILAVNFNKAVVGVSGWDQGDFNYDAKVNGADFTPLATNFNKGAGQADVTPADIAALDSFAAANGLLTSVPEPASFGLLTLTAVGVMARRRRRAL